MGEPWAAAILAAVTMSVGAADLADREASAKARERARAAQVVAPPAADPAAPCRVASFAHGPSRSLGLPNRGRLTGGAVLPEETDAQFTFDLTTGLTPNPSWRRVGARRMVSLLGCVSTSFAAAHPEAERIGVADISRPFGGRFGRRYGGLGHSSHQNGLDVDVVYPRRDLCECPPDTPDDIDPALAQDLVDRFVRAGVQYVFVSPTLYRAGRLRGPRGVVIPLAHHEDHIHVRIYDYDPRP